MPGWGVRWSVDVLWLCCWLSPVTLLSLSYTIDYYIYPPPRHSTTLLILFVCHSYTVLICCRDVFMVVCCTTTFLLMRPLMAQLFIFFPPFI